MEEPPRDREESEWSEALPRRELPRSRRASRAVHGRREEQPRVSRRTREMLALIGLNALLSLIISLAVVIVWETVVRAPEAAPSPAAIVTDIATPTAILPTAILTPGSGEPVVYLVRPGDTLSTIAAQFDVTVEEIMIANDLEDPNLIGVSWELIIPVGGLPEPTPTETPVVSATETPSPEPTDTPEPTSTSQSPMATSTPLPVTPPAIEPEVAIREVVGAGVLADEHVLVFNSGRAVHMKSWTLTDAQDNVFSFPNLFLATGGSVRIHTRSGSNSATDLYWGQGVPMWGEPGDVATLRDESGLVIGTFELP
jgi:LysM repeat protein